MHPQDDDIIRDIRHLQETMERLLSDFSRLHTPLLLGKESVWRPLTDVYETGTSAVVKLEIAGVDKADIDIAFANRILTVTGTRRDPAEKLTYQQMEIKYGDFRTDVFLPWTVKENDIEANYEDGFLMIVLPKSKGTRRVPITVVEENGE